MDKLVHLLNYFRVLNLELDTFEFSGVPLLHDIGPLSNIVVVNKHNKAYVAYLLGSPRTKRVIYFIAHPWSSGPGPRLCVSGRGFDSHPGDQYVRTGNSQSLWDRVVR